MRPCMKPKVLVFIVAYNAAKTIDNVVRRISPSLTESYDIEILIIDDASHDCTFEHSHHISNASGLPFPVHALFNPVNQGYGGNQKLGYHYAIEKSFDFVALLHGDGQYAPERLSDLLEPLRHGDADAVFGSRMLTRPRRASRQHAIVQISGQQNSELDSEQATPHPSQRVPLWLPCLFREGSRDDSIRAQYQRFSFRYGNNRSIVGCAPTDHRSSDPHLLW